MTTKITLVRNDRGDDEMHIAGCADIAKKGRRDGARNESTYEGEDLRAAIVAADKDMAAWFCEEAYTESAAQNGCWTTAAQGQAPCFRKAFRAAGLKFLESGEPVAKFVGKTQRDSAAIAAAVEASLPCTGKWSRPGCENNSVSATWRICSRCTKIRAAALDAGIRDPKDPILH